MKRHQPTGAVYEYEDLMRESPEGEYVLASEALAEIERLRGLLMEIDAAYPGAVGPVDGVWLSVLSEDWDKCRRIIRKSLTPTPNP